MVAMSTQMEGALDVLSCVTLMQLAPMHLPATVNGAVKLFCLFELVNACQSFALGVALAGGQGEFLGVEGGTPSGCSLPPSLSTLFQHSHIPHPTPSLPIQTTPPWTSSSGRPAYALCASW